jgi:putative acetyltransferase
LTNRAVDIRPEQPADYAAIHALLTRAFDGDAEAMLVELLRSRSKAPIALVAVLDGRVVGHVMFSPVTVANAPAAFRGIGLAPLAVLPEYQNAGIGSALIRAGLDACRRGGYDTVFVLGHVNYYPRFGFRRAKGHGLDNEYDAPDAFMVMELKEGALAGVSGLVRYAGEFGEAGC